MQEALPIIKRGREYVVTSFPDVDAENIPYGLIRINTGSFTNPDGAVEPAVFEREKETATRRWQLSHGAKVFLIVEKGTTISHFGDVAEVMVEAVHPKRRHYTTTEKTSVEMDASCFLNTVKNGNVTTIRVYAPADQLKTWQEWAFSDIDRAVEVVKTFT
jgi:hypothetical protein